MRQSSKGMWIEARKNHAGLPGALLHEELGDEAGIAYPAIFLSMTSYQFPVSARFRRFIEMLDLISHARLSLY